MKKYAVMVLAVALVGVMAAGAWAELLLTFKPVEKYVGEEVKTGIVIMTFELMSAIDCSVTAGELPPDCYLEPNARGGAIDLKGELKASGHYSFTVRVVVHYRRGGSDIGYVTCNVNVLPPRNTSDDTPAPISDDIGGNDNPAPAPDPSGDVPAPTPDPMPEPDPDPKPEALSVIAEKLGTTTDSVSYIPSSDMAAPQAPTSRITEALSALSLDIISTQGSLSVSQSGYYAFPLTVPADLVGTKTELSVYLADRSVFGASSFSPSAITKSLTTAQIFTESGGEVTTLPGTIIAAADLAADTARTFSTHIVKAKTATIPAPEPEPTPGTSSGGGGCSSFHALLILTALTALTKSRR